MILTREQIDVIESRASFGSEGRLWSMQSVCDAVPDLAAMARAYHDLRDAVLALCDASDAEDIEYALTVDEHGGYTATRRIREVVARVERGEA